MCSAREKLRQVGSELDTTYEELRDTRSRLGKAIIEKQDRVEMLSRHI